MLAAACWAAAAAAALPSHVPASTALQAAPAAETPTAPAAVTPTAPAAVPTETTEAGDSSFGSKPFVWIFWPDGEADLEQRWKNQQDTPQSPIPRYARAWRCLHYWRWLNPEYDVRLLDNATAMQLSPAYAALQSRSLQPSLHADVLEFDLLSRFGGVWADATACPVQSLATYLPNITINGIFGFASPEYADAALQSLNRTWAEWFVPAPRCSVNLDDGESFHGGESGSGAGGNYLGASFTERFDTWFMASPAMHNPIIDMIKAELDHTVTHLSDGAMPSGPDASPETAAYQGRLVHCIFNHLYQNNETVRKWMDDPHGMPVRDECQHNNNAIDVCQAFQVGMLHDTLPDPYKLMYKGTGHFEISDTEFGAAVNRTLAERQGGSTHLP